MHYPITKELKTRSIFEYNLSKKLNLAIQLLLQTSNKGYAFLYTSLGHKPLFNRFDKLRLSATFKQLYDKNNLNPYSNSLGLKLEYEGKYISTTLITIYLQSILLKNHL